MKGDGELKIFGNGQQFPQTRCTNVQMYICNIKTEC